MSEAGPDHHATVSQSVSQCVSESASGSDTVPRSEGRVLRLTANDTSNHEWPYRRDHGLYYP